MTKANSKNIKVGLIGCGMVGMSFIYAMVNQGIGDDFILIDVFPQASEGNAMDVQDSFANLPLPPNSIIAGTYKDLKDVDLLVITAGRPQKPGETRLDMVKDNAKIMSSIASEVKASGFTGITLIASNPVDVLTYVYQKETGFSKNKVIGSGTVLDSARLQYFLAKKFNVNAKHVNVWVIGEHGDSSVATYTSGTIAGIPIYDYAKAHGVSKEDLAKIHKDSIQRAYEIINRKKSTYYGIGVSLTRIARSVIRNQKAILPVGVFTNGQYGCQGSVLNLLATVGIDGVEQTFAIKLSKEEEAELMNSSKIITETFKTIEH